MSANDRAEQLFEQLAGRFLADPTVSEGTRFGSNSGLRVGGKIFAMLVRGELVVKLSKEKVDDLVASGLGARFERGQGRPMKEWVTVPARRSSDWQQLADDTLEFARSAAPSPRMRR